MFADWTDRIEKGELPFAKPERPKGVERNAVITMWDWATPKHYQHDAASTDKRTRRLTRTARSMGRPKRAPIIPVLDPVHE